MKMINIIKGAFFGEAIGDALGVPVEFKPRDYLTENPITDFIGYRCWNQPPGTFSDDSSMMFCTAESLCAGYDIDDIASRFVRWYKEGYWGAHDELFDIGRTTRLSLFRLWNGCSPIVSGEFLPDTNGNGSLMRILPLIFFTQKLDIKERFNIVKEVSSITHGHFRSFISCFIYVEFGVALLKHRDKFEAYVVMQNHIDQFTSNNDFNPAELDLFKRILKEKIYEVDESKISSKGYVLDSLESSLWCFMNTDTYEECVLKAVNLGGDTDTTGAIAGGISGLHYGFDNIRPKWRNEIVKRDEINKLCIQFTDSIS